MKYANAKKVLKDLIKERKKGPLGKLPRNLRIVSDTAFPILHYFSLEERILNRTKDILRRCELQGNHGMVPTIVLAEFYAQPQKRAGKEEDRRRFEEVTFCGS